MDGVIFKLDYSLNNILWTSYLGGSKYDAIFAIDINTDGYVVVSGGTVSPDLPTNSTSIQPSFGGGRADGFIALINDDGRKIRQITYWGSAAYDQIYLHEFGPDNNLYVFGQTEDASGKFNFSHTGFGQPNSGQFITKFTEELDQAIYSLTFGNGTPRPNLSPSAFLIDNCGNIYTTGWGGRVNMEGAGSYNLCRNNAQFCQGMPVTVETDPNFRNTTDGNDFHIMLLDQDANSLISGFYFGEPNGDDHVDGGTSRFDKRSQIYQSVCASCGGSSGFPKTPGAVSSTNNGRRLGNTNGPPDGCNNAVFKIDFQSTAVSADFSWTVNSCKNDTINFTNQTFSGKTYEWDFGDGTPVSTAANPFHIYSTEGLYYVTLRSTNAATCNKLDSIVKRVVVYPVGKHLLPDSLVCLADTIQLGFTDYPGATYNWSPGRGLSDSTIANPFFFPDTIANYELIINGFGCIDTTRIRMTVDGVLAKFDKTLQTCFGDTVYFNNKSISADRYLWNFGDSTVSTSTNPSHYYDSPGVYKVSLYSTTFSPGPVCNPLDSAIQTIVIYPKGSHRLPDSVFCLNDTISVGFQQLPGATYKWTPPNGLSSDTIANPIITATTITDYMLVINGGGCQDTTRIKFIPSGVVAAFTNFIGTCESDSIRFNNKSSNAAYYIWDFGGFGTSTELSPKFAWSEPGVYPVLLVAANDSLTSRCPKTDTAFGQVIIYPDGVQNLPDTVICRNDSTQLGFPRVPGAKYKWTPPTGLSSDTIPDPIIFADTVRTYTLRTTGLSCIDSVTVKIIPQGVSAAFTFSPGTCNNTPVQFTNTSLGATGYVWDFGDNSPTSTATDPSHVYTGPGTYMVTLRSSTNNPGFLCPAIDSVVIPVIIYPNSSTQLPNATYCRSDTVQIGFAPLPGSIYQWTPANGLSSDTVSNPFLIPDTTARYILVSRAYGCIDSTFINITTAGVRAEFDFTANLCQGDSVRFTDRSTAANSYNWNFGDGATSTAKNIAHRYVQPGIYPVRFIATTSTPGPCPARDTITKDIIVYPNGNHSIPDTTICRSDTVQIGYPSLPGATYIWTPANGVSDPSIADPVFYPDVSRTYTLVSIAAGCLDTTTLKITVDGPLANFIHAPVTCQNDTVFFTNLSAYSTTYTWDFGDNSPLSNDTNTYHVYSGPGRYLVKLVANSNIPGSTCNPIDSVFREVIIYPTGRHQLPDTVICRADTIQIPFDSLPGSTYAWYPGFGLSDSTVASPLIYYSKDTTYTIYATNGGCRDTTSFRISSLYIKLIPASLDTLICDRPLFTIGAASDGSVNTFTWSQNADFSNPINSGPQDSVISVVPTTLTTYYVRGETANCVFIDSLRLLVATGTTTTLPDVDLCFGDSTNIGLNTTIGPGESYTWSPSTALSDTTVPYPVSSAADSIQYRLTAVLNGCFQYFLVDVNVRAVNLVAFTDTFICNPGQSILLVADGKGSMSSFLWTDTPNFTNILNAPGDSTATVFPTGTTEYIVKAKSGSCNYYDTVTVHANFFNLGITDSVPYCNNQPVILDADNMGTPLSYIWTPNTHILGSDTTEQITLVPTGVEVITLTATNQDGCVLSRTITVSPTPLSFLNAAILMTDSFFYKDIPITFQGLPNGPYNYSWTPGTIFSDSTAQTTGGYNTDSTFIRLTITDGTCVSRDSVSVRYAEVICGPPNVFVPNAFTPNNDSENDLMLVRGNHIEIMNFAIYDRWGEKVFETTNQKSGWDGTWKGKPLDPAVFVYYLTMTCKDRSTYFEKGNITLIK